MITQGTKWESEYELTQAVAANDKGAQKDLVNLLFKRVRSLCMYLAGNNLEFEDLAQNAFIEILKSAGSYRGESTLAWWTDRIVVRTSHKILEKGLRRYRLWQTHSHNVVPDESDNVENDSGVELRVKKRMAILMSSLKKSRREVMILHHVQGYSVNEVALMTDTLPNTVRDRLQTGRNDLRVKILNDPLLNEWRVSR